MVSRYYLTVGNLVNQDQTLLTTVVSLDPMFAYFDVDEPTVLRVRKAINEGRIKPRSSGMRLPVLMGLQGEPGFPHEGEVDFVNNQLNPDHRQHPRSAASSPTPSPPAAYGCSRRGCSSASACRSASRIRRCW